MERASLSSLAVLGRTGSTWQWHFAGKVERDELEQGERGEGMGMEAKIPKLQQRGKFGLNNSGNLPVSQLGLVTWCLNPDADIEGALGTKSREGTLRSHRSVAPAGCWVCSMGQHKSGLCFPQKTSKQVVNKMKTSFTSG